MRKESERNIQEMLSQIRSLPFSAARLSGVSTQTQLFQPIATMSALNSPVVPDLLNAVSATGVRGVDVIGEISRQAQQMHTDLMEKIRREATSLFSPSAVLPQTYDWLNYYHQSRRKKREG
jgi:hypothetical protein